MIPSGSSSRPARTPNAGVGASSTSTCCAANVVPVLEPRLGVKSQPAASACASAPPSAARSSHSASPLRSMSTRPLPIAPTCVVATAAAPATSPAAGADAAVTCRLGASGVGAAPPASRAQLGVAATAGVARAGGAGADGIAGRPSSAARRRRLRAGGGAPSGITSLGDVGHGTGSRLSCAHATRAAAR